MPINRATQNFWIETEKVKRRLMELLLVQMITLPSYRCAAMHHANPAFLDGGTSTSKASFPIHFKNARLASVTNILFLVLTIEERTGIETLGTEARSGSSLVSSWWSGGN